MKFNQRKILSTFALFLSSTLPAFAMPYDEKSAWCTDYASNKTSIYSNTLTYDITKAYKYCMKNTKKIMQQRKDAKDDMNERRRKEAEVFAEKRRIREERERKERAEKARLKAEEKEKKRLEELQKENRLDELFGDF